MASDLFDDILDLESDYYQEGYDAGVSDSSYAGMIEGKVFGIEKGYEKALELGKLHGRALVWQERSRNQEQNRRQVDGASELPTSESSTLADIIRSLARLPDGSRLQRQIESLQSVSDGSKLAKDNSDEAVTEFDDHIARSKAKSKVIANVTGEPVNPTATTNEGIEDATGLQARH